MVKKEFSEEEKNHLKKINELGVERSQLVKTYSKLQHEFHTFGTDAKLDDALNVDLKLSAEEWLGGFSIRNVLDLENARAKKLPLRLQEWKKRMKLRKNIESKMEELNLNHDQIYLANLDLISAKINGLLNT